MESRSARGHPCVGTFSWIVSTIIFTTIVTNRGSGAVNASAPSVPAIYVFGDSLADVGTNNYIPECIAKVNMPHHGIDYPGSKPTGRFSNGYNVIDFLSQYYGFKESPPPYLYLIKNQKNFMTTIPTGVNFASGGAGLLDNTGKRPYKKVESFSMQLRQFADVRTSLTKVLGGADKSADRISKSLFLVSVGSNDMIENILFDNGKGDGLVANLLKEYENKLQILMKMGARRIGLVVVAPIGCVPVMRLKSSSDKCYEPLNAYAKQFNAGLDALLKKLSSQGVKPLKYSISMAYDLMLKTINNPASLGFKDGKSACCGSGRLNAQQACKPESKVCSDRTTQMFWDLFHPTQAAYELLALAIHQAEL